MSMLEINPIFWDIDETWKYMNLIGKDGFNISIEFKPYFTIEGIHSKEYLLESTNVYNIERMSRNTQRIYVDNRDDYYIVLDFIKRNINERILDEEQSIESKFFSHYNISPGNIQRVYNLKRSINGYSSNYIESKSIKRDKYTLCVINIIDKCNETIYFKYKDINYIFKGVDRYNDLLDKVIELEPEIIIVNGENVYLIIDALSEFNVINYKELVRRANILDYEDISDIYEECDKVDYKLWMNQWKNTCRTIFSSPINSLVNDLLHYITVDFPKKKCVNIKSKSFNGLYRNLTKYDLSSYYEKNIVNTKLGRVVFPYIKNIPKKYLSYFIESGYFNYDKYINYVFIDRDILIVKDDINNMKKIEDISILYIEDCNIIEFNGKDWKFRGLASFIRPPCIYVEDGIKKYLCRECHKNNKDLESYILDIKINKEDMLKDIRDETKARIVQELKSRNIIICNSIILEYIMSNNGPLLDFDNDSYSIDYDWYTNLKLDIINSMKYIK